MAAKAVLDATWRRAAVDGHRPIVVVARDDLRTLGVPINDVFTTLQTASATY